MPSYVDCVAFSPDGLRLLAGGEPSVVGLWDVEGDDRIWRSRYLRGAGAPSSTYGIFVRRPLSTVGES